MEILRTWHDLFGLRFSPITLIQIAFSAGTVYLLLAVQACSGVRVAKKELEHAITQQKLVVDYLHEIGRSWPGANKIAEILKDLVQKKLTPLLDKIPVRNDDNQVTTPAIHNDEYSSPVVPRSPSQDRARLRPGHKHSSKNKKVSGHWRGGSGNQPIQIIPQQPFTLPSPTTSVAASSPPKVAPIPIPVQKARLDKSDSRGSSFVMVGNSPRTPEAKTSNASSPVSNPEVMTGSYDASMFQPVLEFSQSVIPPQPLLQVSTQLMEGYVDHPDFYGSQLWPTTQWPVLYPNTGFHGMPQGQTLPQAPFWNHINMDEQKVSSMTFFDELIPGHSSFIPSTTGGPIDQSNTEMDTDVSMDERKIWCQSVSELS